MKTLQIRHFPDEVYHALVYRAERAGRSLAQQAVAELRAAPEVDARERRAKTIAQLRAKLRQSDPVTVSQAPEVLIREDRER